VAALPAKKTKPSWLKIKLPRDNNYFFISRTVSENRLHTICRSARCPNISECWSHRTATFLILGNVCTRSCSFCAVPKGTPGPLSPDEPQNAAAAAHRMGLRYAVLTSVTRDDLPDGGAEHFAETIAAVKSKNPGIKVEALIPDFAGDTKALKTVIRKKPEVLNHNLEVPRSLYSSIRRNTSNYHRSLEVLKNAADWGMITKSGMMLGLGETEADILRTFRDLLNNGCRILTLGQYLQAARENTPVKKYYSPSEFEELKQKALEMGFCEVESGPLVRSSYRAHRLYRSVKRNNGSCAT